MKRDGLYRKPNNKFWWVSYTDTAGVRHRESSKCERRDDAETFLATKRVARANGALFTGAKGVTLEQLQTLATDRYTADGCRAVKRLALAWNALKAGLPARALDVTTAAVTAYESHRLATGRSRSTVNYELACLRRAFRLAIKAKLLPVDTMPNIETPTPENTRTGTITAEDLAAILGHLPEWARPVIRFLAYTGWRVREGLGLTWANVDTKRERLRLEATATKGKQARTFPYGALPALATLLEVARADKNETGLVFLKDGAAIPYKLLRLEWRRACRAAKVPGRLMHDLRRSAASNLIDAGVDEKTIMLLCGWQTRSMFDRYHIVKEEAKVAAVAKLAKALEPVAA